MTREQVQVLLATAEELQKHLDERLNVLTGLSKTAVNEIDRLRFSITAEMYGAFAMANVAQTGAYKSMLSVEQQTGLAVFSAAVK